MLVGPVLSRELTTSPRGWRLYVSRSLYVAALFGLVVTAWLILIGAMPVRTLADLARFGSAVFALIAPVQLALAVGFSSLLTAAAVAQEKDRRTFDLLLMTNLSNCELVLGRLLASLLSVVTLIVAAIPLMALLTLLGGISFHQITRVVGVTLASVLAAGSLGSTIALWREKTFQTLALTALVMVLWLTVGEALASGAIPFSWRSVSAEQLGDAVSPYRAVVAAADPLQRSTPLLAGMPILGDAVQSYMVGAIAAAALLNAISIVRVRKWNPSQEARQTDPKSPALDAEASSSVAPSVHAAPGKTRRVWDNPILWREICTWAYGKKILIVRAFYLALFAGCLTLILGALREAAADQNSDVVATAAPPLIALIVLGLVLVNALAVTSITNERDLRALELLLVTDLTPKEIIYGKLGGIFWNAKEMVLLPLGVCLFLWWSDWLSLENTLFLLACLVVLTAFAAMLGVHSGMSYANSRTAVGVSLGTILFLLLGIAVCMRMMVAFQASFDSQIGAFLAFIFGGGVGLWCALGAQRPTRAIALASGAAPFATFFVITSYLQGNFGAAALVAVATYGFAIASLLVPALYEFDVATGRTVARDL